MYSRLQNSDSLRPENTTLLLIDVQKGFKSPNWGKRNNPDAEENISQLLSLWRKQNGHIIHIQHLSQSRDSPFHPLNEGSEFKRFTQPLSDETVFTKRVNSAFIGTRLEDHLRARGINSIVIVGLTTDHCVSTTARMGDNLGFSPVVVSDATATFDREGPSGTHYTAEEVHDLALTHLYQEFASILTTKDIEHAVDQSTTTTN